MLTIFTIPKAFHGHFNIIQRNAIQSWLTLRPRCEIILFGNEKGVVETAAEFKIKHIPEINCSRFGTPLISNAFYKVKREAYYHKLAYLNADIILLDDFIKAVQNIQKSLFLMIGQRRDVDIKESLQFNDSDWEQKLKYFVARYGKLHGPSGMDYFVFPRKFQFNLPSFAVGRPGWDNWLIYKFRFLKIPVIDASQTVTAIHQNHSHSYLQGVKDFWEGPESKENLKLVGGYSRIFTIQDANWVLTDKGFKKRKIEIKYLPRYFDILPVLNPNIGSWPKIISLMLQPKKVIKAMLRRIKKIWKK